MEAASDNGYDASSFGNVHRAVVTSVTLAKKMNPVGRTYAIRCDMPEAQWTKLAIVYAQLPEFVGFDESGVPAWFSRKEEGKHLLASVESSGLRVEGLLDEDDWATWDSRFRELSSLALGFEVKDAVE